MSDNHHTDPTPFSSPLGRLVAGPGFGTYLPAPLLFTVNVQESIGIRTQESTPTPVSPDSCIISPLTPAITPEVAFWVGADVAIGVGLYD